MRPLDPPAPALTLRPLSSVDAPALQAVYQAGADFFIDRGGAIVIAPQFVGASGFCHGEATVHDGQTQWTIDRAGAASGPRAPYVPAADPCAE